MTIAVAWNICSLVASSPLTLNCALCDVHIDAQLRGHKTGEVGDLDGVLDGYVHSGDAPTVLLPPDFVEFCAAIGAIFQYVIDISYDYTSKGGAARGTAEDRPDTHRG